MEGHEKVALDNWIPNWMKKLLPSMDMLFCLFDWMGNFFKKKIFVLSIKTVNNVITVRIKQDVFHAFVCISRKSQQF